MAGRARSVGSQVAEQARAHPLLSLALIIGLSLGLYVAVVVALPSDARRIRQLTSSASRACLAGDAAAVMDHVSPFFHEGGLNKEDLAGAVEQVLADSPFSRMHVNVRHVDVAGGRATAAVHVTAYLRTSHMQGLSRSEWEVGYERIGERWMICSARPLDVNGRRVGGLVSLLALR